ncbi:MAG: DUF2723 domain-containing protein [Anaerolineales bacterium]|nr:DUF2723 domain-containing protein [Anaerolineales bacterium]
MFPLTRRDALLALLTGAGSLFLYIRTLAPGLLYGDSGELQTLVYSLGMSHPTGYPVYILLGRLFALLPFGDLAWRVNLFSAVLGALTVAWVYLIVRILIGWRLAAVIATLALAINPLFWYFSTIAELYVPACAFLSGVILSMLLWRQTGNSGWLVASALLGSLSLGVHSSVALAAPGVVIYFAIVSASHRDWRLIIGGAMAGLALVLIIFLILDGANPQAGYYHATVQPSLSVWDMSETDFDTPFERLIFLYAAKQFRYAMFQSPALTMAFLTGVYWDGLREVFSPLSIGMIGIGVVGVFLARWREGLLLLVSWGVLMFFIVNYNIFDVVVFFVPTYIFLVIWIGAGLGMLMQGLHWAVKKLDRERWFPQAAALAGILVLGLTAVYWGGMVVEAWEARIPAFMKETAFEEYPYPIDDPQAPHEKAKTLVDAVEDNAIVFLGWDLLFPCYFVAHLEENRISLDFHETYPQEGVQEVSTSMIAYIEANFNARPVYFFERPDRIALEHFDVHAVNLDGVRLFQVNGIKPLK